MKRVIYTAIFGNYDSILPLRPENRRQIDAVVFTDRPLKKSNGWDVRIIDGIFDPKVKNREIKILAHKMLPGYEESIYIDGSILVISDLEKLFNQLDESHNLLLFKHRYRNCVYAEGDVCCQKFPSISDLIKVQLNYYCENQLPKNSGLFENGVIVRRHNKNNEILMNAWWEEFIKFPTRDQLSLPFVLNKYKMRPGVIQGNIEINEFCVYIGHRKNILQIKVIMLKKCLKKFIITVGLVH
jgi:hypothetical protein